MTTTTYLVSGMSCDHCVHAVDQEVSALAGVAQVDVELSADGASRVTVTSSEPLDGDAVRAAIDEAGYELVGTAG
jgi:copper chaperone